MKECANFTKMNKNANFLDSSAYNFKYIEFRENFKREKSFRFTFGIR